MFTIKVQENNKVDGYEADHEGNHRPERLERFRQAFRKRLAGVASNRVSNKVSQINRRLDALARLLERDQICVALRYDPIDKKIIISSNKIYQTSRETNNSIKNTQKLMELMAKHEASMEEVIEELSEIIADNLYQEYRYSLEGKTVLKLREDVKVQLEDLFRSGESTKVWEEFTSAGRTGLDADLIRRTSRLARDFIKLRASVLGLSHAAGETKEILEAMRNGKFSLCKNGGEKRHAEMRLIEDLDIHASQQPYIGISKLCCARCSLAVEVLRVPTRGRHGRVFNTWELPRHFREQPALLAEYLDSANSAYEALSAVEREQAHALIQEGKKVTPANVVKEKMLPDTSSSDEVFGLSDASGEAGVLYVSDVLDANAAKYFDREAYETLRESLSPRGVSTLFRASPTAFGELSTARVKALLRSEKDVCFFDLKDLYQADPQLFDLVIEDAGDLIPREGFEAAVARYRRALDRQKEDAEYSDYDDYERDLAAEAEAEYMSETGWGYDDCSDDSQNRFRYSSD